MNIKTNINKLTTIQTQLISKPLLQHQQTIHIILKSILNTITPKNKILIAGRNDLYMHQSAEELVQALIDDKLHGQVGLDLSDHYIITFLGKGWEQEVENLRNVGYASGSRRIHHQFLRLCRLRNR